jgi:hypothetical protein
MTSGRSLGPACHSRGPATGVVRSSCVATAQPWGPPPVGPSSRGRAGPAAALRGYREGQDHVSPSKTHRHNRDKLEGLAGILFLLVVTIRGRVESIPKLPPRQVDASTCRVAV